MYSWLLNGSLLIIPKIMEVLYVNKVKEVARHYNLTSKSFRSEPAAVLAGTANALMRFQAVIDRPHINTAVLFAIAAQDGILAAESGLPESLPKESYEYHRLHAVNYLGTVAGQNVEAASLRDINYIKENYSRTASVALSAEAADWKPSSRLELVRQRLWVEPDKELDYTILALDKTSKQMDAEVDWRGRMMFMDGRNFLVTDRNGESLEHEYGHSQGVGILGFKARVFHAVEEGLVESLVTKPRSYSDYRKTLAALEFMGGRDAEILLRKAYKQGGEASEDLMRFLITHGGLDSLTHLGWMGSSYLGPHRIDPIIAHDFIIKNFSIPGGPKIRMTRAWPAIGFSGKVFTDSDLL